MTDPFKFADVVVQPQQNSVTFCHQDQQKNDVRLTPKEMTLLVLLAKHHPNTLSRDTMIEHIWQNREGADDLVVKLVADLRKKLGDNPRTPKYIQTIPKQGYRLVEPITPINKQLNKPKSFSQVRGIAITVAVCTVLLFILHGFSKPAQPPTPQTPIQYQKTRLIASLMQEGEPRFNPNYTTVFSESSTDAKSNSPSSIAITDLNTQQTSYFDHDPANGNILWSPVPSENKLLYTALDGKDKCGIRVHNFLTRTDRQLIDCGDYTLVTVDWAHERQNFVAAFYLDEQPTIRMTGLKIIDSISGEIVQSAPFQRANTNFHSPRSSNYSHDVAAIRVNERLHESAIVIWDLASNQINVHYRSLADISQVVWKNHQTLLFSSLDATTGGIYQLDIESGQTSLLYSGQVWDFDYMPGKGWLVTSEGGSNLSIFSEDKRPQNQGALMLQNLSKSRATEHTPYLSRSKQWISYLGDKLGQFDLYKHTLGSDERIRLTDFDNANVLSYSWNEDESQVLLNLSVNQQIDAVLFDVATRKIVTRYKNVIAANFGRTSNKIFVAQQRNQHVEVTTNQQVVFTLPDQTTLNRFEVFNNQLLYQKTVFGPLLLLDDKGAHRPLKQPNGIAHWYVDEHAQLVFSFQATEQGKQSAKWPIAQLDLTDTNTSFKLLNRHVPKQMSFVYNHENRLLYYTQKMANEKSTVYLLKPIKSPKIN